MENNILFQEIQKFRQWWIWAVLLLINGISIFGVVYQVLLGNTFGNNPADNYFLILTLIISLTISILLLNLRLETKITNESIYLRFFWFHFNFRKYEWKDIRSANVRQYKPILEYGGWGIRGLWNNRAFNVSGNKGLQLEFHNGRKLLIGTGKPDELSDVIKSINLS